MVGAKIILVVQILDVCLQLKHHARKKSHVSMKVWWRWTWTRNLGSRLWSFILFPYYAMCYGCWYSDHWLLLS